MKTPSNEFKRAIIIGLLYFAFTVLLTLAISYAYSGGGREAILLFSILNAHYFGLLMLFEIGNLPVKQILLVIAALPLFNIIIAYFLLRVFRFIKSKVHLEFKK